MIVGPSLIASPKVAHLIERTIVDAFGRARRNGVVLPDELAEFERDVTRLAQAFRSQSTDAADARVSDFTDAGGDSATLSSGEVGLLLGVTDHGVRDLARRGRLRGWRLGGTWQFEAHDVEQYRQKREHHDESD